MCGYLINYVRNISRILIKLDMLLTRSFFFGLIRGEKNYINFYEEALAFY